MFSKKKTIKSTNNYWEEINKLKYAIDNVDAILIGAGSGMSTSAGFTYSGQRFNDNFSDFIKKYKLTDMYSAGFYPYDSIEEYWAFWSRFIYINRYDQPAGKPYTDLLEIIKNKNYFVITTNVDHRFQVAGFDKSRLFYTQGDYGLWQCSVPCHQKTYDNEKTVRRMVNEQKDMRIPSELIPYCPYCGAPLTMNLRIDNTFVEDDGWHEAALKYNNFLEKYKDSNILYLELGVGNNTPAIIKYNFWSLTAKNPKATYANINFEESYSPNEIQKQSILINDDIKTVLDTLKKL